MPGPYSIITDGTFATAEAISGPVFVAPFPWTTENYVLRQDFMQAEADFVALELSTAHPDYTDYLLVEEGEKQALGGGLIKWTRTYAKLPDTWEEIAGTYAYNFIGYYGVWGINVTAVTGRERFTRTVPLKVVRTFYHVATGELYTDPADIPIVAAQTYYYTDPDVEVDYIGDSPPLDAATTPSLTEYQADIAAGTWIAVEPSSIERWMGNYYMRTTRYVQAQ